MTIEEKRWTEKGIDGVIWGLENYDFAKPELRKQAASIIRQQRAELAELRKKQKDWIINFSLDSDFDSKLLVGAILLKQKMITELEAVSAEKEREP